jgi:hypothetical protein
MVEHCGAKVVFAGSEHAELRNQVTARVRRPVRVAPAVTDRAGDISATQLPAARLAVLTSYDVALVILKAAVRASHHTCPAEGIRSPRTDSLPRLYAISRSGSG